MKEWDLLGPPGTITHVVSAWGVGPALVMVLAQHEAARLLEVTYPWPIALLTFAGTLAVYGADRYLERRFYRYLGKRHLADSSLFPMIGLVVVLGCLALPFLTRPMILWAAQLGLMGAVYLAITVNRLRVPPLTKEVVGAFLFTWLVWGFWKEPSRQLEFGFFLMGLSNFLAASQADRFRDKANGLRSFAVVHELANRYLVIAMALLSATLFGCNSDLSLAFLGVAFAHAAWPGEESIDWAFLPLLFTFYPMDFY